MVRIFLREVINQLKYEMPYSFKAKLKNNQSLKVRICSKADDDSIWHCRLGQMGDWQVDTFNSINKKQYFHLKGSSESDLQITFQTGAEVNIELYENGDACPSKAKSL